MESGEVQGSSGSGGLKRLLWRLFTFGIGSGLGLVSDFVIFWALSSAGLPSWLANCISSVCGTTIVYFVVTRHTWKVPPTIATYVVFLAWYSFVIILTSVFIEVAGDSFGIPPLIGKLITVPISFTVNFIFNRFLFERWQKRLDSLFNFRS